MRTLIWRLIVMAALFSMYLWIRGTVAGVREECRLNRDRQVRLDKMVDKIPAMVRAELSRHRNELVTWMESRDDGKRR